MFCSWCKKKIHSVWEYTNNKEPLCSQECTNKYFFGIRSGMISKQLSLLSSDERKLISSKWNDFKALKRTLNNVRDADLPEGKEKYSILIGFLVTLIPFSTLFFFDSQDGDDGFFLHSFKSLTFLLGIVIAVLIHNRLVWLIKFYLLKKKLEKVL